MEAARTRGIILEAGPPEHDFVLGWSRPSAVWGHPCGLVLLKGRQVAYPRKTREWCVGTLRELLASR